MKTIREHIQAELEKFNDMHVVSINPKGYLGKSIDRINSNINKMAVEIDGVDFENGRVPRLPNCHKTPATVFQSVASSGAVKFELEFVR